MNIQFSNWLPALTSTGALAATLWFARTFIEKRLSSSVQHKFDRKIEELRSDIRVREGEIEALRKNAISGQRRVEAVDKLWSAMLTMGRLKWSSQFMSIIKFEGAAAAAEDEENTRKFFETLAKSNPNPEELKHEGDQQRPFVTPVVWALFSAYRSILMYAYLQLEVLKNGLPAKFLKDGSDIADLIKKVAPEYSTYMDEFGSGGFHFMLDTLEEKTLAAMRAMLDGAEYDQTELKRASEILKAAEQLQKDVTSDEKVRTT